MHNKGKADITIYATSNILKHLTKNADLDNPQTVETFIATKQTNAYKDHLCTAYARYCQYYKINWEMPTYNREEKMPKLPTEEQLNKLIAGAGKTLSLKLWISKETGLRPIELQNLKVKDVDTITNLVYPITAKNGSPRVLKIPIALSQTIQKHAIKNNLEQNDKLFKGNSKKYGKCFRELRAKLARNLNEPSLTTIRLYDFRHYFATMTYYKLRDTGLTAQDMGHKDWNTTRKYIHLVRIMELNQNGEEYIVKTAHTKEEAIKLLELGFIYQNLEFDGDKVFKKRK